MLAPGVTSCQLTKATRSPSGWGWASAGDGDMESTSHTAVDPDMEELFSFFLDEGTNDNESSILDDIPTLEGHELKPNKQPFQYQMRDTSHKAFYLQGSSLVATNLQGDNTSQEETISVVPNRALERRRCPLILGIKGGSQTLSCGTSEQPQLQLEDVPLMELFQRDEETKRFTFYKSYDGSTHRFEAAAHSGCFLCTAAQADQPLGLTTQPGQGVIVDFFFRRK